MLITGRPKYGDGEKSPETVSIGLSGGTDPETSSVDDRYRMATKLVQNWPRAIFALFQNFLSLFEPAHHESYKIECIFSKWLYIR